MRLVLLACLVALSSPVFAQTNVTGTITAGSVTTTFQGTTTGAVTAGQPFVGTINAVAPPPPPPPPPPPTTINVGQTTVFPGTDGGNANLILAQPITLTQAATIQSLSFYVDTAVGQLRLGIYSDSAGLPKTKMAETPAFTTVKGWNTQVTTGHPVLAAGKYWLAYLPQSNGLVFRVQRPGGGYYKPFNFATMPSTFPTSPNGTGAVWSFYATFLVSTAQLDTTPPSIPTNLTAVNK